ncbi:DinB family protein [Gorillibacterium sp. sgz5001074]|uniref:DinB family protein n=1 Tax=Gorillibacterium sp. sgz5001074 TaxID=3446695 RepID=UPI003F67AA6E
MNRTYDTQAILKQVETLTSDYIRTMESYSIEQLQLTPSDEDWSLGQMYLHLARTTQFMQVRNIVACREGSANPAVTGRGKTEPGEATFSQDGFPPVRIRVPASPQYTPPQPESKEEIRNALQAALELLCEVEPALAGIPPEYTVEHPRLGGLNAVEWFALAGMHYRHHLLQQERLEQFLASVQNSVPRTLA